MQTIYTGDNFLVTPYNTDTDKLYSNVSREHLTPHMARCSRIIQLTLYIPRDVEITALTRTVLLTLHSQQMTAFTV